MNKFDLSSISLSKVGAVNQKIAELVNTEIIEVVSKIMPHVPISFAPSGKGRLWSFINLNLSTYNSTNVTIQAKNEETGKATAKRLTYPN
jgi:hypothetical protein